MFQEIVRSGAEGAALRVLIELETPRCLSYPEALEVVASIPRTGISSSARIALQFNGDYARQTSEFAETAATNRGILLRAFASRPPALAWLLA